MTTEQRRSLRLSDKQAEEAVATQKSEPRSSASAAATRRRASEDKRKEDLDKLDTVTDAKLLYNRVCSIAVSNGIFQVDSEVAGMLAQAVQQRLAQLITDAVQAARYRQESNVPRGFDEEPAALQHIFRFTGEKRVWKALERTDRAEEVERREMQQKRMEEQQEQREGKRRRAAKRSEEIAAHKKMVSTQQSNQVALEALGMKMFDWMKDSAIPAVAALPSRAIPTYRRRVLMRDLCWVLSRDKFRSARMSLLLNHAEITKFKRL